jgi:peptide/nickel transport system ATP-binding protein
MSALLEVRDLAFQFAAPKGSHWLNPWRKPASLRAVDGLSFSLAPGKTLGLVGESGCGKSTTARLVLGLLQPSAGTIFFEGQAVPSQRTAQWRSLRRRMQMVYQDPLSALDRRLPVIEQVAEPLLIFAQGNALERRAKAADLMAAVGLTSNLFARYPHELSGGQRQRVVLARALVMQPSLLVCDEPISALDVSIQAQVINLLQDLQQRLGMAFLFISHDLKVVRQISDEVAVMYLGRIVERGAPAEIFQRPAHPYTQALVSAIASPWRSTEAPRVVLQGDPPNPSNIPSGCAFHPRCAHALPICREQRPDLLALGSGRLAACHLLTQTPALGPVLAPAMQVEKLRSEPAC